MIQTIAPPEERVLIHDVSWDTYQRLLSESVNQTGTRFAYNDGELEIMVVYVGHENPNRTLAAIVEITAEETGRDFLPKWFDDLSARRSFNGLRAGLLLLLSERRRHSWKNRAGSPD